MWRARLSGSDERMQSSDLVPRTGSPLSAAAAARRSSSPCAHLPSSRALGLSGSSLEAWSSLQVARAGFAGAGRGASAQPCGVVGLRSAESMRSCTEDCERCIACVRTLLSARHVAGRHLVVGPIGPSSQIARSGGETRPEKHSTFTGASHPRWCAMYLQRLTLRRRSTTCQLSARLGVSFATTATRVYMCWQSAEVLTSVGAVECGRMQRATHAAIGTSLWEGPLSVSLCAPLVDTNTLSAVIQLPVRGAGLCARLPMGGLGPPLE